MKTTMRTSLILTLACCNLGYAQSIFIPRTLNCPGSETLGKNILLADIDNDGDLDLLGNEIEQGNKLLIHKNLGDSVDTRGPLVRVSYPTAREGSDPTSTLSSIS